MRDAILSFGTQLTEGAALVKPFAKSFDRIVACGMGGSSVAGEILSMVRDDVVVHWDWDLPAMSTRRDFVVCTSWSGNTAETLSSYDSARKAGNPLVVITSGGELARKAQNDGVVCILLPARTTPPRVNAGLMIGALFAILDMAALLPILDPTLTDIAGSTLASAIGTQAPIFYAGHPWRKIAGFFKTTVNENAKRQSWSASFPSVAHNEIMGWSGAASTSLIPVVIRDTNERPHDRTDFESFLAIMKPMGYTIPTISLLGASPLEKALNAYVMALWTGWHMAVAAGIDATSTEWIDEFKELKAKN